MKRANPTIAVLAAILGLWAITLAQGAMYQWSKTAASNATADATINWAEGMSPSSVNDSARAMMARLAEYRDDISGLLTTGGSSIAYTVTTNQGLASTPNDGQLLAITVHTTNGVAPTLQADGGTAYPIQSSSGTGVAASSLVSGSPYTLRFSTGNSAWMLRNFYGNPFNVPLGAVLDYVGATAPNSNFVLAFGQCISRTTYSAFFALVSTTYGVCDGTTTFGVPDFRGYVVAGKDDMGGSAANRITNGGSGIAGTSLGATGGSQNQTISQGQLPNITLSGNTSGFNIYRTPSSSNAGGAGTFTFINNSVETIAPAVTVSLGGSGQALTTMPPTRIVNKIVRIF